MRRLAFLLPLQFLFWVQPTSADDAVTPPNILVIVADDLGYADVGFNGCSDILTPNIDCLADQGVRCTSAYVTHPFCSPSRAALLTGRYQQRFGHENNPPFLPNNQEIGLPTDQRTLADVLGTAGYVSCLVGKWHLGAAACFHPLNRGFTHMFGFLGGGHLYSPHRLTVSEPSQPEDQYRTKLLRDRVRVDETDYLTDAFSREAVAFVRQNHERPFFLYLAYNAPHTPLFAPEEYIDRVAHIPDTTRRVYAAMVTAVDDGVGRVLDALTEHDLDERTLIFFLSDNGGPHRVNGSRNNPLRAGKGSMFEGGIRVPFAVRWTGTLPAGEDYDQVVSAMDIFATAAHVSGAALPEQALDGVNILPHLRGEVAEPPHDLLFWRRGGGEAYAVRSGSMKLTELMPGAPRVYNVKVEPNERNELGVGRAYYLSQLEQLKQEWESQLMSPRWESP